MKLIDVIIFILAISMVLGVVVKKWKQRKYSKKHGITHCGGSCAGCSGCPKEKNEKGL